MIVSGFTQKKSYSDADELGLNMPGQHSHCLRCRQVNCSQFADNVTACLMVTCESCGWRCHECKQSEHVLTCPEERVACVNKEYGCPHILKRSKMAAHLPVCPASVVCCVEEWSRWPMHARDKGMRMPLPQTKTYMDCGQLDVGLAMRDQRMLIDSLRAPRKLRRTLRNALTQKYPAAPLTHRSTSFDSDVAVSEDTSQTVSDDEADAPWDLSKPHPGLKESIRSRLFRVTKETTDSLAAALEMTSTALASSQSNRLSGISEGGDGSDLPKSEQINVSDIRNEQTSSLSRSLSPGDFRDVSERSMISSLSDVSLKQVDGRDDEASIKGNHERALTSVNTAIMDRRSESTERIMKPSDGGDRASQSMERSVRSSVSSDRCSDSSTRSKSTLHDVGGTQLHKLLGYQPEEGQEAEILLHKMLGVSVNFECINKYVSKPSSMYTFICAQNFRRDEYRWHFKNIHQEIHTGLAGWLEQRCPLAYLGCTFSFNRLEPSQPNRTLYHSWLQESFGLRTTAPPEGVLLSSYNISPSKPENALHCANTSYCNAELESKAVPHSANQDSTPSSYSGASLAGPSISDLANIDKDFYSLPSAESKPSSTAKNNDDGALSHLLNNAVSLDDHIPEDQGSRDCSGIQSSPVPDAQKSHVESQERDIRMKSKPCMRVQPTIYTACNWDSKVVFQYDVEEEEGYDESAEMAGLHRSLVHLPFEVLQQIAKHLDSFTLCNLALTCRLLREVCCSLLDDHGIVVLNWQRQRSEVDGHVSWRVTSKRWLFSTSFEPIESWKFTNHPSIGEHLKVCPFNKDVVRHMQPMKVMIYAEDQPRFGGHGDESTRFPRT